MDFWMDLFLRDCISGIYEMDSYRIIVGYSGLVNGIVGRFRDRDHL